MNGHEHYQRLGSAITEAIRLGLPYPYKSVVYQVTDRTERNALIELVTCHYLTALGGCRPKEEVMNGLTDAILFEELRDRHPDKAMRTEYPILSEWQLQVRHKREVSDYAAKDYTAERVSARPPIRRVRTAYETAYVDSLARIREAARAAKDEQSTRVGAAAVSTG
ncbi:hypothetical protein [Gorillibacterium sp. sgz500922]|uniref:hypothetical protein n=1 Tax=Gorillibacterium sp. sgz500922 TaxID=3446694 RepID=UPI003F675270